MNLVFKPFYIPFNSNNNCNFLLLNYIFNKNNISFFKLINNMNCYYIHHTFLFTGHSLKNILLTVFFNFNITTLIIVIIIIIIIIKAFKLF